MAVVIPPVEALRELRIAYIPNSADLSNPGDRRRFWRYAKLRNLPVEVYDSTKSYDVVVLSTLSDISHFGRLPGGPPKLVYDMPDSYLDVDASDWRARLRAPAKYLLGEHRHFEWSFLRAQQRMCRRADLVVCSTPEQRTQLRSLNGNVHAILDFHDGEATRVKSDYDRGETLNLFWEGVGGNMFTFGCVADVLREFAQDQALALHVMTDLTYRFVNGPLPELPTSRLIERYLRGVPTFLYQWNREMLPVVATACDLAVIPMPADAPIFRAKPENKLLLLWRMGVPTLTSATKAYERTMRAAGVDMLCATRDEWRAKLRRFAEDAEARRSSAVAGMRYADQEHGTERVTGRWDEALATLLPLNRSQS